MELEEIVPEYHSSNKYVKNIFFKRFEIAIDYLHKIGANKILDAGCGEGIFTNILKNTENFEEVIGLDINENVTKLNEKFNNIKFIVGDICNLPFYKYFDAIVCLDVLEHIEHIEDALLSIYNALDDEGYLIVSGPTENFWYKLGRFLTKGTFSEESGPNAGKHYYNIFDIDKLITKMFEPICRTKVRFMFAHLFSVNLYRKSRYR